MAGDFARNATAHGDLRVTSPSAGFVTPQKFKRGRRLFGSALGPPDNQMVVDVYCTLPRNGGKTCASYEIRRTGPGARSFTKRATRPSCGVVHRPQSQASMEPEGDANARSMY